jgi:hypothetical protein
MDIKRIDIKEFREKGYLQELNRRFLHPLGLALEIIIDDDNNEKLGGIWDYRNDEEGIYYDIEKSNIERKRIFNTKKNFIDSELGYRREQRKNKLGFDIEPVSNPDIVNGEYILNCEKNKDEINFFNYRNLKNQMVNNRLFGQIDHPLDQPLLKDITHSIVDIKLDEDKYLGYIIFLNNKNGESAYSLINSGEYEFRPRMNGGYIISWDICKK